MSNHDKTELCRTCGEPSSYTPCRECEQVTEQAKAEHQLDEMVNAIQQVTNISEKKATIAAKLEVIHIITQDHDESVSPHQTIIKLINWASN